MLTWADFVRARHRIWLSRQLGLPGPWSEDKLLSTRKFTNVFRVLDPGSQFILTDILPNTRSAEDCLLQMFLYRHTNLPSCWRWTQEKLGHLPTAADLPQLEELWEGEKVFSSAYMVRGGARGLAKHRYVLRMTSHHFRGGLFGRFQECKTQEDRFATLRNLKGVGPFMAMQILTDWGYSPWQPDSEAENRFVVPGPGAIKGAQALPAWATTPDPVAIIQQLVDHPAMDQVLLPEINRRPSWMDVQNTLCEYGKYVRLYTGQPANAPRFTPSPGQQPEPIYPQAWY